MDAIKMVGIVKCFGPVRANDGIDFTVKHQDKLFISSRQTRNGAVQ